MIRHARADGRVRAHLDPAGFDGRAVRGTWPGGPGARAGRLNIPAPGIGGLFCALLLTLTGHAFFTTLPLGAKPSEWLLAVSLAAILLASEARPRALMVLGAVLAFARLPQSL